MELEGGVATKEVARGVKAQQLDHQNLWKKRMFRCASDV